MSPIPWVSVHGRCVQTILATNLLKLQWWPEILQMLATGYPAWETYTKINKHKTSWRKILNESHVWQLFCCRAKCKHIKPPNDFYEIPVSWYFKNISIKGPLPPLPRSCSLLVPGFCTLSCSNRGSKQFIWEVPSIYRIYPQNDIIGNYGILENPYI